MKIRYMHTNLTVQNMEKSPAFYEEALSLTVSRKIEPEDGSFLLVYLLGGY